MSSQTTSLYAHSDFIKLWAAQTISEFGTQITQVALSLVAVLTLGVTPTQMGILRAVEYAPFLIVGLFAGMWVDRLRRRPILITADLGRAILLGSIPLAAFLKLLQIEQLYIVSFLIGVLTVFFDVAYPAFLPSLLERTDLVNGNSKLELSHSVAQVAGPGIGGGLVQLVTAPLAIIFDALSFVISAGLLALIHTPESESLGNVQERNVQHEISEGLHAVLANPTLRALMAGICTANFFDGVLNAVLVIYIVRQLHVEPVVLGAILAAGGVGSLLGALIVERTSCRFGTGPSLIGAAVLIGVGRLLIPLASGPIILTILLLILAYTFTGFGFVVYGVNLKSLNQSIMPDQLLGRVFASQRFLAWGSLSAGLILGGIIANEIGLRVILLIGSTGVLIAVLWLLFSPIRTLYKLPGRNGS